MRRLKKLGLFFLILLIAVAVGLFILHRIGVSKLASRGGGTIPTADELVYPELTDAENAAILYRAASNTFNNTPDGIDDMTLINYGDTVLERMGIGKEPDQTLTESDMQVVDVLMVEADPVFEILQQVRTTKGCLFLNDHSPAAANENISKMLETGAMMRSLSRKVKGRAIWEAEQGNTDTAHDWVATGLHMANDMNDESVLIGELIRQVVARNALSAAQGTLYDRPVSEAMRQAMLLELGELRDRKRFGDSMRRDAVLSEGLPQAQGFKWFLMAIQHGNYLETLSTFMEAVEMDDYAERTRMLDAFSDSVAQSGKGFTKFLHVFDAVMLPTLMGMAETFELFIAECDLLELALSLRAYEHTHGAFPDTLTDLTPEFLSVIPEDPLNGKAYLYEKSDQRITVRSEETTKRGKEIAFHLAPLANTPEAQ